VTFVAHATYPAALASSALRASLDNDIGGEFRGYSGWSHLKAEGDIVADFYLPAGKGDEGACPVGIESLHFQQGYNRDYESDDYFHDWLRIGYKCVTRKKAADGDDPVIWQDVQRDQTRSFDTGDYEFQADDFGSLRVFNVTCADQQGSGNKKVLRGLEVKRFETKGVQLGGKGRAAMEKRDQWNFRAVCDFLPSLEPDQYSPWVGTPYGNLKESQGVYCMPRRKHGRVLSEPNMRAINIRLYDKPSENQQALQFRISCDRAHKPVPEPIKVDDTPKEPTEPSGLGATIQFGKQMGDIGSGW
jgi:hypothetical protein